MDNRLTSTFFVFAAVVFAAAQPIGCISPSLDQERYDELIRLGADDDGDEDHNPGFPCADCHGDGWPGPIGEKRFALAGTVYLNASDRDEDGLPGVMVHFQDARGFEGTAQTNEAGNFMFEVRDRGENSFRMRDEGKTKLNFEPEFPIQVWIESGGVEQRMRTPIRDEASCATCHFREPGARSVGRIFLAEDP